MSHPLFVSPEIRTLGTGEKSASEVSPRVESGLLKLSLTFAKGILSALLRTITLQPYFILLSHWHLEILVWDVSAVPQILVDR